MSLDPSALPLHDARVLDVHDETSWCVRVRVDVSGAAPMRALATPGQYVALATADSEPRWFVVASRAAELPIAEFLIGRGSDVSDAIAALGAGDTIRVSAPQGAGFAMQALRTRPVAFFASGTGIAAVRPVIDELLDAGHEAGLSLFYQERLRDDAPGDGTTCEFACVAELERWARAGVDVQQACDARPIGAPAFVDALYRHGGTRPPAAETAFVVCGNPALEEMVAALLTAEGLDDSVVHRNY